MRQLSLSSLALLCGIASSAVAADLPPAPEYRAPAQVVAERFTWTGVYVGANAGYGMAQISDASGFASRNLNGGLAGGQIGYNWQSGALVFGAEGDFQATWQKRSVTSTILGVPFTASQELPWFGTVRGRVGAAFDRHLLYVTAGAAWVDVKFSLSALGTTISSEQSKAAWTAGAGWEWMFADKWSVKAEYLYLDTGNTTITLFGATLAGRGHDHIARGGVNYHF